MPSKDTFMTPNGATLRVSWVWATSKAGSEKAFSACAVHKCCNMSESMPARSSTTYPLSDKDSHVQVRRSEGNGKVPYFLKWQPVPAQKP